MEFQAERSEAILAACLVPVYVHSGFASAPALHEETSLTVDVARPDPRPISLPTVMQELTSLPPHTACIGLTAEARPLLLRLPSPDVVHVLVAGASGSGKTELIRSLLVSLALGNRQSQLQVVLIDLKQRGLSMLAGLPHLVAPPAYEVNGALQLLDAMVAEMERRDAQACSDPHIVIVADELPALLRQAGPAAQAALTHIAERGHAAGLHLVVGTQQAAGRVIGSDLKANIPVRLVGRVDTADEAHIATGIAESGAEHLLGRGDFLAVSGGQAIQFQSAYVPAADWAGLDAALRRREHWTRALGIDRDRAISDHGALSTA
ncbi:MAG: FtsK/SpoIIIE domain-containing protein [Anaerolineales bacterium]